MADEQQQTSSRSGWRIDPTRHVKKSRLQHDGREKLTLTRDNMPKLKEQLQSAMQHCPAHSPIHRVITWRRCTRDWTLSPDSAVVATISTGNDFALPTRYFSASIPDRALRPKVLLLDVHPQEEELIIAPAPDNITSREAVPDCTHQQMTDFENLKNHIEMTVTSEGLRIELSESASGTFFDTGSTKLKPDGEQLLVTLAQELGALPNKLSIEGHTDSALSPTPLRPHIAIGSSRPTAPIRRGG